ncbi:MAG: lysozyme inhibitor LprI family protein [Pseudomonadota bacterium]
MRAGALALLVLAAPVAAQAPQIDCQAADLTQTELTFCAAEAWEAADGELNLVYGLAITQAKVIDEENALLEVETPIPVEQALRQAQRDWIVFRDAACSAEAMLVQGGTAQPMVGTLCLARLTRRRTDDLRLFVERN